MKIDKLPDFAKKFKTKGFDVRKKDNQYYLYKITSKRVPDKKNPILISEYIGKIDKKEGLIKKERSLNSNDIITYVEYGLSHYIYKEYKRILTRSLYNIKGEFANNTVTLGIVKYLYNSINEVTLKSSYISYFNWSELLAFYNNPSVQKRVGNLANKIDKELKIKFESFYDEVIIGLKNMIAVIGDNANKIYDTLPINIKNIFEKCGVTFE